MSALKTEEDLADDSYEEYFNADGLQVVPGYHSGPYATITDTVVVLPGMIPRPADQRFSFSLLFQDEMPRNPDYKVLLSLFYGSGLPYGPPSFNRYQDVLRTPAYRRVDVGFSRALFSDEANGTGSCPSKSSTCWASTTPSTTTGFRTSTVAITPCPTS